MPEPPELSAISHVPLSIVLTAFNDEAGVERTLRGWIGVLNSLKREYEIILVDDGSSDRTVELAKSVASQQSQLQIHQNTTPTGVGAALRTGIAAAKFPLICFSSADRRYSPQNLTRFLDVIDKVHLVAGYRVSKPARIRTRWDRFKWRFIVRIFFGVRLKDVDCAFKLFRREIFARIPIQSNGTFAPTEILAKANFLGKMITEVAVEYRENSDTESTRPGYWNRWRDAQRVFFHPDFGSAILPEGDAIRFGTTPSAEGSTNPP
jgi:glycosyltransferase involved in cell wall biosynthesis